MFCGNIYTSTDLQNHKKKHMKKLQNRFHLDCDQTQLMVEVPAISHFALPTDGKGVLVWFHFLLSAGLLLTGYC